MLENERTKDFFLPLESKMLEEKETETSPPIRFETFVGIDVSMYLNRL